MAADCSLYTMVFDFRGGTYISQNSACSPQDAVLSWANGLKVDEIVGLGKKTKAEIINIVDTEGLIAIKETTNVWCAMFSIRGNFGLLNVIKTESI